MDSPQETPTPQRLMIATLLGAFAVFVVDLCMTAVYAIECSGDNAGPALASGWCGLLFRRDIVVLVLLGPPALTLMFGIYAVSRRDAGRVRAAVVGGFVLCIAAHVPDWLMFHPT
jgi:hypothetical protein